MKYLNKYNEEIKFEYEWDEECVRLQKEINKYNDLLINDEVWKNHYHRIDNYYEKQLDSDFLESIIEFGKNRIKEIDKENKELLQEIKDILEDIEDNDDGYIDKFVLIDQSSKIDNLDLVDKTGVDSIDFSFTVHLIINNSFKRKRKIGQRFKYSSDEVINQWPKLIKLTNSIKSLGLDVSLNLQANWQEIIFDFKRIDI
jgi:uncharacterized protein YaaN involved in tellurite resistance